MKSGGHDLMDTNVSCENHITRPFVLGTESPDIIPLAVTRTRFGKTKNGAIVADHVLTVLVFALHLAVEYLKERLPYIASELERKHMTMFLLWREYRMGKPDGYCYTQFCYYVNQYTEVMNILSFPDLG